MENDLKDMVLEDENGNKVKFELVTKLDIENREYVIAIPHDGNNSKEAIALRIDEDENGNSVLSTVEDDIEFSDVVSAYEMLFEDDI